MLFNSLQFLIFFPIVVSVYFVLPHRFRWFFLLCSSYYFYMCWKPEYVVLIMISTIIDYYAGLQMWKTTLRAKRKKYLILSLVSNFCILFAFKYFNFFNESARHIFNHFNILYNIPAFKVLLPIGISFYTFQTLSYSIDVYRGHQKAEKHLGIFALYVAFFPQLVAGPIERSINLLPQFYEKHSFDYQRIKKGLLLMSWGFFKKLVIADHVAVLVDQVYNHPADYTGTSLIIATYFFAFQIYCDFSGYSDIVVGAAQVLGFDLMTNFNFPYMAKSVAEFWKRWHISLSTWFRDYLYIPLGGNRVTKNRWFFNIFAVFLLSGLWHGANWTFIIWGALHGSYLLFSIASSGWRNQAVSALKLNQYPRIHEAIKIFVTFHFVVFAWIFFRANSIKDAVYISTHLFTDMNFQKLEYALGLEPSEIIIAVMAILIMEIVQVMQRGTALRVWISQRPLWLQCAVYYSVIFCLFIFKHSNMNTPFIYFQF